ncbi:MAG: toll/interleukin-1 receptor domain-containing protein [Sphingomicrobium sp.]
MADVFISYARDDQAAARRVAKGLQAADFDVWWDADLPAHRAYSEVIERNLEEAKAVVVLWSTAAAKSQWVRAEADFARNAGKLVQAQVDESLPPMPFNQMALAETKAQEGLKTGKPLNSVLLARVYATEGRQEDAISLLSGAVARGWLPQPPELMMDLQSDPALASLNGDPRFEKLRGQIIGRINRERAQVDQRLLAQLRSA